MEKWKAEKRFPLSHSHDYGCGQKVFATVARRTGKDGRVHLAGSGDVDAFTTGGCGESCGPGDENDFCAASDGGFGKRVTHAAAGAVADEAHGVYRLARASGGDHHRFAGEI